MLLEANEAWEYFLDNYLVLRETKIAHYNSATKSGLENEGYLHSVSIRI